MILNRSVLFSLTAAKLAKFHIPSGIYNKLYVFIELRFVSIVSYSTLGNTFGTTFKLLLTKLVLLHSILNHLAYFDWVGNLFVVLSFIVIF